MSLHHNQPPKLEVSALSKTFGTNHVLESVSFRLDQGQSLAVLGRSGTGKSVLFKCVVGLLAPDSGEISIDGSPLSGLSTAQRRVLTRQIAVVFQGSALFDSLPVWRNIMFSPLMRGQTGTRAQARERAVALLEQVGLSANDLDKSTAQLSGGMQKRVAIARALAQDPSLIFFDEPTTGLDPITAGTIDRLIASVTRSSGATTVTITHDLSTARLVATQALFLDKGHVAWRGHMDQLDRRAPSIGLPGTLQQFLKDRAAYNG